MGRAPMSTRTKMMIRMIPIACFPFPLLRNQGFVSTAAAKLHPGKYSGRLFHDQIILYGFDPVDATCDLTRFIDGLLRINEAAQLNDALESFNTDLE